MRHRIRENQMMIYDLSILIQSRYGFFRRTQYNTLFRTKNDALFTPWHSRRWKLINCIWLPNKICKSKLVYLCVNRSIADSEMHALVCKRKYSLTIERENHVDGYDWFTSPSLYLSSD